MRRLALFTALAGVMLLSACGGDGGESGEAKSRQSIREAGQEGPVTLYEVESSNHVEGPVDYPQTPPVGGDHSKVWQNCGFYDKAVGNEHAVHSMEHGAVWITYSPDLAADQVEQIRQLATGQTYVLASAWDEGELPAPIVFSAWGAQLEVEALPSPVADAFTTTYRNSPNGPEPGAPCDGATSEVKEP